jgi:hypothetical protein
MELKEVWGQNLKNLTGTSVARKGRYIKRGEHHTSASLKNR